MPYDPERQLVVEDVEDDRYRVSVLKSIINMIDLSNEAIQIVSSSVVVQRKEATRLS